MEKMPIECTIKSKEEVIKLLYEEVKNTYLNLVSEMPYDSDLPECMDFDSFLNLIQKSVKSLIPGTGSNEFDVVGIDNKTNINTIIIYVCPNDDGKTVYLYMAIRSELSPMLMNAIKSRGNLIPATLDRNEIAFELTHRL